jgi:hypothetical protein
VVGKGKIAKIEVSGDTVGRIGHDTSLVGDRATPNPPPVESAHGAAKSGTSDPSDPPVRCRP